MTPTLSQTQVLLFHPISQSYLCNEIEIDTTVNFPGVLILTRRLQVTESDTSPEIGAG